MPGVHRLGCSDVLVVTHGGAGGWDESRAREALRVVADAASRGLDVILARGDVIDAVATAVKHLEDSRVLNAGLGSVLTLNGLVEMDAGIMDSSGLTGAVASVRRVRNPVLAALIVARETPHILMAGEGAERLALSFGVAEHPGPLPERVAQHYKMVSSKGPRVLERLWRAKMRVSSVWGDTVGCVAGGQSVLAAATSTGGVWFKLEGRVGDTPIPGAGFYATRFVACSATGIGETILAEHVCLRIAELVESGVQPAEALERIVERHTERYGRGTLGVIIVARESGGVCGYAATNAKMPVGYASRESRGSILAEYA